MEGHMNLAQGQEKPRPQDPTCAHLLCPDDSHDGGRNFQELPLSSSFWLASPSRPSSGPQLAPAQLTATEGK